MLQSAFFAVLADCVEMLGGEPDSYADVAVEITSVFSEGTRWLRISSFIMTTSHEWTGSIGDAIRLVVDTAESAADNLVW